MLLLKRLTTGVTIFIPLFLILFIGSITIGSGIAGARLATEKKAQGFDEGYAWGEKAGREFGEKYGGILFLAAGTLSLAVSIGVPFSGLPPWCRKSETPE